MPGPGSSDKYGLCPKCKTGHRQRLPRISRELGQPTVAYRFLCTNRKSAATPCDYSEDLDDDPALYPEYYSKKLPITYGGITLESAGHSGRRLSAGRRELENRKDATRKQIFKMVYQLNKRQGPPKEPRPDCPTCKAGRLTKRFKPGYYDVVEVLRCEKCYVGNEVFGGCGYTSDIKRIPVEGPGMLAPNKKAPLRTFDGVNNTYRNEEDSDPGGSAMPRGHGPAGTGGSNAAGNRGVAATQGLAGTRPEGRRPNRLLLNGWSPSIPAVYANLYGGPRPQGPTPNPLDNIDSELEEALAEARNNAKYNKKGSKNAASKNSRAGADPKTPPPIYSPYFQRLPSTPSTPKPRRASAAHYLDYLYQEEQFEQGNDRNPRSSGYHYPQFGSPRQQNQRTNHNSSPPTMATTAGDNGSVPPATATATARDGDVRPSVARARALVEATQSETARRISQKRREQDEWTMEQRRQAFANPRSAAVIELRPALREANRRAVIEDSRWFENRGDLVDLTDAVDSEEERQKEEQSDERWEAKMREAKRWRTIQDAKQKRPIVLDSDEEEDVKPKRAKLHGDNDAEPKEKKETSSGPSDSFEYGPHRSEAAIIGEISDAGESYLNEDSDEEEEQDEEEPNWEELIDEDDIQNLQTGGADPPMSRSQIAAFDELCRKDLREAGYDADNENSEDKKGN